MIGFKLLILFAAISASLAEPPISYSYLAPSYHSSGSTNEGHNNLFNNNYASYISGSGGHNSYISSETHSGLSSGYTQLGNLYQSSEGKFIDPQILHKVKEILLEQENLENSNRIGSGHGGISHSYGVPSLHYGLPKHHSRYTIKDIQLGHIKPSIQVAQFQQTEHGASDSYSVHEGHYPHISSHGLHSSYEIPSGSYGPPPTISLAIPSGSYGVPH